MAYSIKQFIVISILIGSLVILFLFVSTNFEGEGQHFRGNASGEADNSPIGQTFLSHYNNLSKIAIMTSSFEKGKPLVTFNLKELSSPLELYKPIQQQVKTGYQIYELYEKRHIGQSFTASCPDLKAIHVLMSLSQLSYRGKVIFHLKSSLNAESDIVTISKDMPHIKNHEYNTFDFSPIHDSQGKMFYYFLETEGISPKYSLKIPYTLDETYQEGSGYISEMPITGDIVFKKEYVSPLKEKETLLQIHAMLPDIPETQSQYRIFSFSPIRDSKGKFYYFFFEVHDGMFAPWQAESDLYEHGTKIVNHFPANGDLTFKVFYKVSLKNAIHHLLRRISQNKLGLLSQQFFYIMIVIVYLFFFILFLWQLTKKSEID